MARTRRPRTEQRRPEAGRTRLRLTGGEWRGRKLACAEGAGLRPTLAQNRERLFNWLQGRVAGARVLDAFAGSGILGLEALSRGAAHCTWVETWPAAADSIEHLVEQLAVPAERGRLLRQDLFQALPVMEPGFNLVFLDPPFERIRPETALQALFDKECLSPTGWAYLELPAPQSLTLPPAWSDRLEVRREVVNGRVRQCLVRWRVESPDPSG